MFDGDSPLAAEYFEHEVLIDLPPDTVRFMMETSVLEAITTELCQEVTDRADARTILEGLAARFLLMPQLDTDGCRHRYPHLLAEFLRRRLAAQDPEGARQARLQGGLLVRAKRAPPRRLRSTGPGPCV